MASRIVEPGTIAKDLVLFYGFDAVGLEIPDVGLVLDDHTPVLFPALRAPVHFDQARGAVIAQGAFERPQPADPWGDTYTELQVDWDLLLEKEKDVQQLLKRGGWVLFLVGRMFHRLKGFAGPIDAVDTDLCKRLLAQSGWLWQRIPPATNTTACAQEFQPYLEKFGVAKTALEKGDWVKNPPDAQVLARVGQQIAGIAVGNSLFFLPFHFAAPGTGVLRQVAQQIVPAVEAYRKRMDVEVPDWADEFSFSHEELLRTELAELESKGRALTQEVKRWRGYKAILSTKQDRLKLEVKSVLHDFWQLSVQDDEEFVEDLKITDQQGQPIALVEVKGKNGGVQREDINQVDSHRERRGLDSTTPGLLVINHAADRRGISEKQNLEVAHEQISHARKFNVLVLRTVDLLFLMRQMEDAPDRKTRFLDYLGAGGGWLRADSNGAKLEIGGGS